MDKNFKAKLKTLYKASDIAEVWNCCQNYPFIQHSQEGWITPNKYRAIYKGKPCPFCGKKMVHGKDLYSTSSRLEAVNRGYEYKNSKGINIINQAGHTFFHPHYVTLDHKINKARCPELMFDYDNLQIMCWKCNYEKGDNNGFELQQLVEYLDDLASETLARYQLL